MAWESVGNDWIEGQETFDGWTRVYWHRGWVSWTLVCINLSALILHLMIDGSMSSSLRIDFLDHDFAVEKTEWRYRNNTWYRAATYRRSGWEFWLLGLNICTFTFTVSVCPHRLLDWCTFCFLLGCLYSLLAQVEEEDPGACDVQKDRTHCLADVQAILSKDTGSRAKRRREELSPSKATLAIPGSNSYPRLHQPSKAILAIQGYTSHPKLYQPFTIIIAT